MPEQPFLLLFVNRALSSEVLSLRSCEPRRGYKVRYTQTAEIRVSRGVHGWSGGLNDFHRHMVSKWTTGKLKGFNL
ncbi:hypothetical protein F5144DRAFT_562927 [Chaetomium tenue]|uniref:Uncharacterized protein n=1 Tax=Chaetomium tenue TaxID=1854479 RepID=A0ACB7PHF7_9PEZI|nr:hypothetical protein F5144DRAFT_562927 [Chaetomium globosum]